MFSLISRLLTGLFNRRYMMDERLNDEITRAQQEGASLSLNVYARG